MNVETTTLMTDSASVIVDMLMNVFISMLPTLGIIFGTVLVFQFGMRLIERLFEDAGDPDGGYSFTIDGASISGYDESDLFHAYYDEHVDEYFNNPKYKNNDSYVYGNGDVVSRSNFEFWDSFMTNAKENMKEELENIEWQEI